MTEIIENIIGGKGGVGGIFGEAREALIGGCWGLFMSAGFFFAFFVTGLAMLFNVTDLPFELGNRAIMFPFVCIIGISALLSPFMGALFGAQSGIYSVVRHIFLFIVYLGGLLACMFFATIYI